MDDDRADCPAAEYTSIQAAVDAASAGDTIAICPGSYLEGPGMSGSNALTIGKSLTIKGAGADLVSIKARGPQIIEAQQDIRNGVGDVVSIVGASAFPVTVDISGVTVDGNGSFVEAGIVYLDAQGSIFRSRVTNIVTSELAADSTTKPGAWRDGHFGYGVAQVTANVTAPAGAAPRTLSISQTRVDRYNRVGVLIDGATNDLAPYTPSGVVNRGELSYNSIVGRLLCTNFGANGNCTASGSPGNNLATTGPLFGQDGVRVTAGSSVALLGNTISQNLVNGTGAPTRGQAANNANLPLAAGVRLVGAGPSTATRNNIVDNAYGVHNSLLDGVTPNEAVPFAAENNWWGLRPGSGASLPNAGPAISPTTNPPFPENPVNGAGVADGEGTSSSAVDFYPYRSGAQGDGQSGQFIVFDAPLPVDDAAPALTAATDKPVVKRGEKITLTADASDDFGVKRVTYYEGAAALGSAALPPYALTLGIAGDAACADRTVTAVVEDSQGQTAAASTTFRVDCSVVPAPEATPEPTPQSQPQPQPQPQTQTQLPAMPSIAGALPALGKRGALIEVRPDAPGGVRSVDFFLGTRKVCSKSAAPFACMVRPTGDDVGAQVLRVVVTDLAGQTAENSRSVRIGRFSVRKLRLDADRLSATSRTKAWRITGRLDLYTATTVRQACRSGHVTLALKRGNATLADEQVAVTRNCTFTKTVRVPRRGSYKLVARFGGNAVLLPANANRRLS